MVEWIEIVKGSIDVTSSLKNLPNLAS